MTSRILTFIKRFEVEKFHNKYGDKLYFKIIYRAARFDARIIFGLYITANKFEMSFFKTYFIIGRAQIVQPTPLTKEEIAEFKRMEENGEL